MHSVIWFLWLVILLLLYEGVDVREIGNNGASPHTYLQPWEELILHNMSGKRPILTQMAEAMSFSELGLRPYNDQQLDLTTYTFGGVLRGNSEVIRIIDEDREGVKIENAVLSSLTHLVNTYLAECSLAIFSEQDTREVANKLRAKLHDKAVKLYDLKSEVLDDKDTWSESLCDGYFVFITNAKEFLHHADFSHYHHSIHDDNPQSLWNYQAHYVVVLPSSSNSSLHPLDVLSLYNFQKTTKVVVLQPKDGNVRFWSHRLYREGSGVRYVGSWRNGKFSASKSFFNPNLDNFYGAPLRVATFDHAPSVVYAYDENHNIVSRLGVDMQIVQTLAKAKNFSLDFIEVNHDELWGFELPNGTWTGLLGKVFYEKADIGACNVFLELHRWKMVDYSAPYNFERGCFVAPSPKPLLSWRSPFLPFAWDTWISIAAFLAAGGLLLFIVANLSKNAEPSEFLSFSYDYLYILGALTMKSFVIEPNYMPVRLYMGFTWLFGLIISTAYSANLIAFLSVTKFTVPIDTMQDLSKSSLRLGGVAFWKTQFIASIDPTVQNFVNKLETDVDFKSLFDRVEAGEFALIENKQYLELQALARYTYGSTTTIRIVRECLLPYSIGLAFQKNSPLKTNFDRMILQLFEAGVVQKWKDEVITYFRQQFKDKRKGHVGEELQTERQPLTLKQLQGVFYLLGIGYLLAAVILVTEIIVLHVQVVP